MRSAFALESGVIRFDDIPFAIPPQLRDVRYNGDHFPGAPGVTGVEGGANCQQFAYTLLRHHGFDLPDLRSDQLWLDALHTVAVTEVAPFDLVLLNSRTESFGAHVGLCVGNDLFIHLSRRIGMPAMETLERMQARDEYRYLIGFKRVLRRSSIPDA